MTPEDVAAIRARGYTANEIALCDALEAAWAERARMVGDLWAAKNEAIELRERVARAETLHAEFYALADKQAATLARVRDLCDPERDADGDVRWVSVKQIRAELEGGDQ